jgi:hypothetical protein
VENTQSTYQEEENWDSDGACSQQVCGKLDQISASGQDQANIAPTEETWWSGNVSNGNITEETILYHKLELPEDSVVMVATKEEFQEFLAFVTKEVCLLCF